MIKKEIVLFLFLLFSVKSTLYAEQQAGTLGEIGGQDKKVDYIRQTQKGSLKVNDPLFFQDWVLTQGNTTADLRFTFFSPSKIDIFLYENSKFLVDQHVLKQTQQDFITRFSRGFMKIMAKGLNKNKRLLIYLSHSLVGVRGSILWVGALEKDGCKIEFVILEKGARVFLTPLQKNKRPQWKKTVVLPSKDSYTTILLRQDNGMIDRIFPEYMDPATLQLPPACVAPPPLLEEAQQPITPPKMPDPTKSTVDRVDPDRLRESRTPPPPSSSPPPEE